MREFVTGASCKRVNSNQSEMLVCAKSFLSFIMFVKPCIIIVLYLFTPVSSAIGLLRLFRIFRIFKLVRYSKTMVVIANVLRKAKYEL